MKKDGMLGNNRIEDVRWLCSLSESELDILISLRKMATRRQSFILKKKGTRRASIRQKSLSKKFDLKMLRDLSFVLMQVVKERLVVGPQMAEERVDNSTSAKCENSQLVDIPIPLMAESLVDNSNLESLADNSNLANCENSALVDIPLMAESVVDNSNLKSLVDNSNLAKCENSELVDIPQMAESLVDNSNLKSLIDNSNLAKYEISEEFRELGVQELTAYIRPDRRKRISKLFEIDDLVTTKKRRLTNGRKQLQ